MIKNSLCDSIRAGDLQTVREWLDAHPEDLNAVACEGYTPLHLAVIFGEEKIMNDLLFRGALVNLEERNVSRNTPLHAAVLFHDEDVACRMAGQLIDHGAELNARQSVGLTALHQAVARNSLKLVEYLIEAGADPFLKDQRGRTCVDLLDELRGDHCTERLDQMRTVLKSAFTLTIPV